jgi:anaphase-promoting complex subunit 1
VPPTNTSLALDMSNTPSDMLVWPEFHNGVAAGLRLPRASESFKVSRSWIVYNKGTTNDLSEPDAANQATNEHGGLLMALGLRGHLSTLSMTDIYEYLTQGSVTTSVGVLIGMSCAKRGTCDMSISKMLCLHIPSLLPPSFSSIDVSSAANAAAVAGLGILYQGSSHRLMTEFLLNEMGRRPVSDSFTVDREAYTLSCGLALGMINLAKGGSDSNAGLADLELEQRLYRYVVGGLDDRANRRRQDLADRRVQASVGGMESERCSRVYEGDTINNDITAPGALLALGLIFMKSG